MLSVGAMAAAGERQREWEEMRAPGVDHAEGTVTLGTAVPMDIPGGAPRSTSERLQAREGPRAWAPSAVVGSWVSGGRSPSIADGGAKTMVGSLRTSKSTELAMKQIA